MKNDSTHIKKIKVVSNTHWDREFRRSFEKTRRSLLTMLDITLEILEKDSNYHSFTMDGHSIMIDDYLEMRPEKKELIEKLVEENRLIIGPYYTLAEQFSISQEAMIRNLLWGKKTVEKYGGKVGTVAYTPSSWGQTGQLPQILLDFGLDKMMFYRGISHHEADAEYVWSAPDGSEVLASRFAVYARYNWYYQVHRAVTRGKVFDKDYNWGCFDEIPFRVSDSLSEYEPSYEIIKQKLNYYKESLSEAVEEMVKNEGNHFTTDTFLAMNGHDISVAYPLESNIIEDCKELLGDKYEIEHTDLEGFWKEAKKTLNLDELPVLVGERRAYLKEGMWTFLFPGTISARTYLKQKDFNSSTNLVYLAEPMAVIKKLSGGEGEKNYTDRGWSYLLSNHTHDANGGCAPDVVCADMEYRYRKVKDISDIIVEDSLSYITKNLKKEGTPKESLRLVGFNSLPFERDVVSFIDLEIPRAWGGKGISIESLDGTEIPVQMLSFNKSSVFVDNVWDVPTILNTNKVTLYAKFDKVPALGYKTYIVKAIDKEVRTSKSLVQGVNTLENDYIKVKVNSNGTVNIHNKETGKEFMNLNYFTDEGECGNAWKHVSPIYDKKFNSLGEKATVYISESGPLRSSIIAELDFYVPRDYENGATRSSRLVPVPIKIEYILDSKAKGLKVNVTLNNTAKDHWLRVNFPTKIKAEYSFADSHFDVVKRNIKLPDSTGWIEKAEGTHPLRTFVDVSDGKEGLSVFTKGIFEFEAFDDNDRNLAITLIRACRIKLAVSEEKQTELPDGGIQCPGEHTFEYMIFPHLGDYNEGKLINEAINYITPVRSVAVGNGDGDLNLEESLLNIDNLKLHISAIKEAEDGEGIIIRLFNPTENREEFTLNISSLLKGAYKCKMDETVVGNLSIDNSVINMKIEPKKILTLKLVTEAIYE